MSISDSYNSWADTYDAMDNKTRDLEAEVLRDSFLNPHYANILELGCGTGKNTGWLSEKADFVTAIDFSKEMISKAKDKMSAENITFVEADITSEWPVKPGWANIITCSLVLEHIKDFKFVFEEAERCLKRRGMFYICELHPFRQYNGSQAKFETSGGVHKPDAFTHHISEYLTCGKEVGLKLIDLNEHFDNDRKKEFPRLISIIFEKE